MNTTQTFTATDAALMTGTQLTTFEREAGWEPAKQRALAAAVDTDPKTASLPAELRAAIAAQLVAAADAKEAALPLVQAELARRAKGVRVVGSHRAMRAVRI